MVLLLCGAASSAQPIDRVEVDVWGGRARVSDGTVEVAFSGSPLSLGVSLGGTRRIEFVSDGFFRFNRGEVEVAPERAISIHRRYRGFRVELATADSDAVVASLLVTMDESRHIRLEYHPAGTGVQGVSFALSQSGDEHYYGMGDLWHTDSVDMKGAVVDIFNHTGTPDECSWVPFFMSTAGYGLFVDSAYRGKADFGTSDPVRTVLSFQAPDLSLHLWVGESMREILPQYLEYTGYPPHPPAWTFLPHKWRDEGTWEDVFEDVHAMREHDMPLGAVWIDRPWMQGEYGSDDFLFDEKRYPDARDRIRELHDLGVRVLVWGCDFLTEDSQYFQEGLQNDYYVGGFGPENEQRDIGRYLVDFANPAAREWFKGIIRNALDLGVDGVKLDRGQNYPLNVTPPSGRDPRAMHNYHGYLMVKTYAEALQEARGRDYQLTPRAGWAGTQSWTVKWPGDMDSDLSHDRGLPAVIRAQSAAGLTGFAFWGSDIGGYGKELSKEVFVRWLQHGVFSPLMQMPGKGNHEDVPFSWDEETVRIYKWYAQLREKMLPYILEQAEVAHRTGTPLVRHLAWGWEDDPEVHSRDYQYMFGGDLLVACVVDLSGTREVYLPEGEWVDFWDRDRVLHGPRILSERVPLARIPLYIRKEAEFGFELPDLPLP
jgi:alpha-D-xyloside xylohydrolase